MEEHAMVGTFQYFQINVTIRHFNPDINECTINNGNCSDICTNTVGSYICSCMSGFVLNSNGRTCDGEATQILFMLVASINLTIPFSRY